MASLLDVQKDWLRFFGTLEDRAHHFQETSVLGLLQTALYTILHDRNEFLVAQLIIICKGEKES